MSTKKQILFNAGVQIFGKGLALLISLATIALTTRALGVEYFGFYTTIITFLSIFGVMADFGLVLVSSKLLSLHTHDEERMFGTLLSVRLLSALVIIGSAPLIVQLFPYPAEIKEGITLSTIAFIAIAMTQITTGLFQRNLTMIKSVFAEIFSKSIGAIGVLLAIYYNGGLFGILLSVVIAQCFALLINLYNANKTTHIRLHFHIPYIKQIFTESLPIGVGIFFNTIYLRGDALMLSLLSTQTDVGLYGAAYRILDIVTQAPIMLMGLMIPLLASAFYEKRKHDFDRLLVRSSEFMIITVLPIIVGCVILSEKIMVILGGEDFAPAGKIAAILTLALLGGFAGALFGHVNVAIGRQKNALWIYAFVAITSLTGYFLFIPTYSTTGAALVTVFSETLAGTLLAWNVLRYTKTKLNLSTLTLKVFIAASIMGVALLLTMSLPFIVQTLIALSIYVGVTLVLNIISREELAMVFKK